MAWWTRSSLLALIGLQREDRCRRRGATGVVKYEFIAFFFFYFRVLQYRVTSGYHVVSVRKRRKNQLIHEVACRRGFSVSSLVGNEHEMPWLGRGIEARGYFQGAEKRGKASTVFEKSSEWLQILIGFTHYFPSNTHTSFFVFFLLFFLFKSCTFLSYTQDNFPPSQDFCTYEGPLKSLCPFKIINK